MSQDILAVVGRKKSGANWKVSSGADGNKEEPKGKYGGVVQVEWFGGCQILGLATGSVKHDFRLRY